MSGHSQFKNIMYRKGAQDAKKARVFAKLAREITVAAKSGLPEPDKNPRLRLAIQAARAESMPKDNTTRRSEARHRQSNAGCRRRRFYYHALRGFFSQQSCRYC